MFGYEEEGYSNPTLINFYKTDPPNVVYTSDPEIPLTTVSQSYMSNRGMNSVLENRDSRSGVAGSLGISGTALQNKRNECELSGSGDKFNHLVSLTESQNPTSAVRCGWVYDSTNPNNGQGKLGRRSGPEKPITNGGTWMWNLKDAKKRYHTAICNGAKSCEDLQVYPYSGRCGWCTTSGKAVPITSQGRAAYSDTCSSSSLVGSGNCPAPTPLTEGWTSLPNGNLKRSLLISKAQQAGCSDDGTLIKALQSGSDTNYLSALTHTQPYSIYQNRAIIKLDEAALKKGAITQATALTEFNRLHDQANSSNNDVGLRYAARDLCLKSGVMDTYDFCSELLDSTRGPYDLGCLQKKFLSIGGQKSGSLYPSPATLSGWNAYPTWGKVVAAMQGLKTQTGVEGFTAQETAMDQFYGPTPVKHISRNNNPGVEIFWFTHEPDVTSPTVFLGRRIRATIPFINQANDIRGVTNRDRVSMVFFTDIKSSSPSMLVRVTSDDGFAIELNRSLNYLKNYKNGLRVNNEKSLVALDYFPPTTFTLKTPWEITANGPNVLNGYWFQWHGQLYFKLECQNQKNEPWSELPATSLMMTQNPFAAMIDFKVHKEPHLFGADFNFADSRMGSLKMKWNSVGTPSWNYPNRMPAHVNFKQNTYMQLTSGFKMYSFMTMLITVKFNSMPNNSVNMEEYISMPGQLGKIALQVTGTGTFGKGTLNLYTATGGLNAASVTVSSLTQDVYYLLVLRVNRTDQSDIYSVNGLSLAAGNLYNLMSNPSLNYTTVTFPNKSAFSNPDSLESRKMIVGNGDIDIRSIKLYDYYLADADISREIRQP